MIQYQVAHPKGRCYIRTCKLGCCLTRSSYKTILPLIKEFKNPCVLWILLFTRIPENFVFISEKEFEARDLSSIFTLDAFASAGFGIEQNSFKDPDNIFRKMSMTMISAPGYGHWTDIPRMLFITALPGKLLNPNSGGFCMLLLRGGWLCLPLSRSPKITVKEMKKEKSSNFMTSRPFCMEKKVRAQSLPH